MKVSNFVLALALTGTASAVARAQTPSDLPRLAPPAPECFDNLHRFENAHAVAFKLIGQADAGLQKAFDRETATHEETARLPKDSHDLTVLDKELALAKEGLANAEAQTSFSTASANLFIVMNDIDAENYLCIPDGSRLYPNGEAPPERMKLAGDRSAVVDAFAKGSVTLTSAGEVKFNSANDQAAYDRIVARLRAKFTAPTADKK